MKINQIQSQLAVNRQLLAKLHIGVEHCKYERRRCADGGHNMYAQVWHKEIQMDNKRIAKLVALQKALKKDLARELMLERTFRKMDAYRKSAMANVGEIF